MTAGPGIDMSGWLHEQLDQASPDLLRGMVRSFAQALMSADADAVCGAAITFSTSAERLRTVGRPRGCCAGHCRVGCAR